MMDFKILTNPDGHYCLWPANRESPRGWSEIEGPASEDECLVHIREVWARQQRSEGGSSSIR